MANISSYWCDNSSIPGLFGRSHCFISIKCLYNGPEDDVPKEWKKKHYCRG